MRDDTEICDEINSLAVNAENTDTGVTSYVQEACTQVEVMGKHFVGSKLPIVQADIQNLTSYFERPRLISRGALPTASRGVVGTWDMSYASVLSYFPQALFRLTGVYGMKASLKFRLQVATTPFHQGLLALSWQYAVSTSTPVGYRRGARPEQCTNLPHVRLDLSESTMVELKIPFISSYEFWTNNSQGANYGLLNLNTVLPVAAVSGINAPTYELYINLEDIELFSASNPASTTITPQSGKMVKKKNVLKEEQEDAHILSDTLSHTARIARFVSRNIPLVSSISGPAAWVLDHAAGVARYFGYSKTQIGDPPLRIVKQVTAGEHNVDQPSSTYVLGPMSSNTLSISDQFSGSGVDEMSLAYVLSQYAQICVGTLATTDASGAALYACNITPAAFWFRAPSAKPFGNVAHPPAPIGAVTYNSFIPSHAFWWCSLFKQWRGGFKFRVTFAKTKLHGGRLLLTYLPQEWPGYTTGLSTVVGPEVVGGLVQPFGYSAVFDLRDSNQIEFEIPYTASLPYMPFNGVLGGFSISIIDPLQAPSVVSQSVPFVVEVCCMPEFELAFYGGMHWMPHLAGTPTLQSGKIIETISPQACELAVGEHIKSAKQLVMIPSWLDLNMPTGVSSTAVVPWFNYNTYPSTVPMSDTQDNSGFTNTPGAIATCYSFVRGSTDFHAYPSFAESVSISARYSGLNGTGIPSVVPTYPSGAVGTRSSSPAVYATNGSPLHLRLPAYSNIARVPMNDQINFVYRYTLSNSATGGAQVSSRFGLPLVTFFNWSSLQRVVHVGINAGEDAMLGMYIGPPLLALPRFTATSPLDPDTTTGPLTG